MTIPIPKRLRREPLIETVWQVQFEPEAQRPVGELLPGLLFTALRGELPDLRLVRLPTADIPHQLAATDPHLRFAAKYRIEAPDKPILYHVGDAMVTINCRRPYPGWAAFKEEILKLMAILEGSALIPQPLRHSLRYLDLLPGEFTPALANLNLNLNIGAYVIDRQPLQFRVELSERGLTHVLQLVTPAMLHSAEGSIEGALLIDLETLCLRQQTWSEMRSDLESLHDASKAMFFRQVLSPQTIERLEPEY